MGGWRGRTLAEVADAEPVAVSAWLSDPDFAGHGGESLRQLCDRVAGWLTRMAAGRGPGAGRRRTGRRPRRGGVRARVPVDAFWRLDVPPLTATELSGRGGRWNLGLGRAPDRR